MLSTSPFLHRRRRMKNTTLLKTNMATRSLFLVERLEGKHTVHKNNGTKTGQRNPGGKK